MKAVSFAQLLLRAALGAVFVVSGFQKLIAPPENFAAVIEKFEIIHGPAVNALSQVLPWLEFILGVFFILGFWTRFSLFALWTMNTAFIGILASTILRKIPVDECGCFGAAVSLSLPQMLALDSALWALFFLFFISQSRVRPISLDARF